MWVRIFTSAEEARNVLTLHKPQLLMVEGQRIVLVQTNAGLLAVQDFCTHNKESLSKGRINFRDEIICPWHGYCFDLRTGRESQQRSEDLATYPIRESEDGIFIELKD